jgi:hypothetical protein
VRRHDPCDWDPFQFRAEVRERNHHAVRVRSTTRKDLGPFKPEAEICAVREHVRNPAWTPANSGYIHADHFLRARAYDIRLFEILWVEVTQVDVQLHSGALTQLSKRTQRKPRPTPIDVRVEPLSLRPDPEPGALARLRTGS